MSFSAVSFTVLTPEPGLQTKAEYRGLLEAAPDAMVVVDQGGQIVLLNGQAEKQFGYSDDELIGQQVTTIIPVGFAERLIADDLRSAEDALGQQIATGIELSGQRKDDRSYAQPADLAPTVIAAPRTDKPATARPLRILVVDDTAMNRDIARSFLRMAGHEVLLAEDGVGAVGCAAAGNLDVVLMDVRMPNMDGLEATRRIRALQGSVGRVPIVALTAQVFAEQIEVCRQAGMDSHLAKPFTQESLLAAVSNATTRLTEDGLTSDLATADAPACGTSCDAQALNTVSAIGS